MEFSTENLQKDCVVYTCTLCVFMDGPHVTVTTHVCTHTQCFSEYGIMLPGD